METTVWGLGFRGRIWSIWGSCYNIPKAIFYLLTGGCNSILPDGSLVHSWGHDVTELFYWFTSLVRKGHMQKFTPLKVQV